MSWTRKVLHPSEVVKKGGEIEAVVLAVDQEKKRVALGIKQLVDDPWQERIPQLYAPGTVIPGKVTKVTNFGVFVELEKDLEGLLHISELSDRKVDNPSDFLDVGQDLVVKVIKIDETERKIGLSLRKVTQAERESVILPEEIPAGPEPESTETPGATSPETPPPPTGQEG
jgi:small subunit ribosomal protein S1